MKLISAQKLLCGVTVNDLPPWLNNCIIDGVVTDSRKAEKGKIFVAIKGENVDGHDYVQTALQNGASLALVTKPEMADNNKKLLCADALDAMIAMSANYRAAFSPVLTAVTGSVGKTTTKEFCYAVFSQFGETLKTEGNQNNEIGMPNTLFRLTDKTRYAVVEMGMQGLGEIRKLTLAAKPCAAIITGIGHSHLQQLKTRENICKAKMEICEGLPVGGLLVINLDDEFLPFTPVRNDIVKASFAIENKQSDVVASDIKTISEKQYFTITDKKYGSFNAVIPTLGKHNIYNALAAYTVATRLGLDAEKAVQGLAMYTTTGYRQNIVKKANVTVIEDCYNANPDSMRAGLSALSQLKNDGKAVAVLGDMLELGDISKNAHYEIGAYAAGAGADLVLAVGQEAKYIADGAIAAGVKNVYYCKQDKAMAAKLLFDFCQNQNATVLFKASRGMKFEDIMQSFYEMLN